MRFTPVAPKDATEEKCEACFNPTTKAISLHTSKSAARRCESVCLVVSTPTNVPNVGNEDECTHELTKADGRLALVHGLSSRKTQVDLFVVKLALLSHARRSGDDTRKLGSRQLASPLTSPCQC